MEKAWPGMYRFYLSDEESFDIASRELPLFPALQEGVQQKTFVREMDSERGYVLPLSFPRFPEEVYVRFVRVAAQVLLDEAENQRRPVMLGSAPNDDIPWQLYQWMNLASHMHQPSLFFKLYQILWRMLGLSPELLETLGEHLDITPLTIDATDEVLHLYNKPDASFTEAMRRLSLGVQLPLLGYEQLNWVAATCLFFYNTPLTNSLILRRWAKATLRLWPVEVVQMLQQLCKDTRGTNAQLLWLDSVFEVFWELHRLPFLATLEEPTRYDLFNDRGDALMCTECQYAQDPYRAESWPTAQQLRGTGDSGALHTYYWQFLTRYMHTREEMRKEQRGGSETIFYQTEHRNDVFAQLMDGRWDLFVRQYSVPLDSGRLQEILDSEQANIVIGHALNELRYGYSHVLSIHFITIVDWALFVIHSGQSDSLVVADSEYRDRQSEADPWPPTERAWQSYDQISRVQQLVVMERTDYRMSDLMHNKHLSLAQLRAVLWQTFHALEMAWYTNRFLHQDLHIDNVMLQDVDTPFSPLRDRSLLYKRRGEAEWWRVPRNALNNRVVKIIDFDLSRAYVPAERHHLGQGGVHQHTRYVLSERAPDTRAFLGAWRNMDCAILLSYVLRSASYMNWLDKTTRPEEMDEFYAFCGAVMDFKSINDGRLPDDPLHVTVRTLRDVHPYQNSYHYASAHGASVTDALNHPFFSVYKLPQLARLEDPQEALSQTHAVASFALESDLITFSPTFSLASQQQQQKPARQCKICGIASARKYCGGACQDFEEIFHCKTVYR
jgi:hypothetical protein